MPDGRVEFEITADHRNADQAIQEVTATLRREGREWEETGRESTDEIGNSFNSMLKKVAGYFSAAKIGKMLLNLGKEAISLASDLEEVQNVVDTTFGPTGASKIESWAKKAGTQFGLTETQAKKFTSTLGAMMKSAGMSGDEIVDMSTDLAGLAADMASFYNLDFDTAFQKIRSGISGETEPLKQLGINMSVANLNAFALEKGLKKTFDQMSQGEQTMLRYEYLMQATADAQGDFARTSDGFANATRSLETNMARLKTKVGELLIPAVNDIVGALNGLFGSSAEETVNNFSILDRINEIQINKDEKIAQIEAIASEANSLIEVLATLTGEDAGKTIESLANGANVLSDQSKTNWEALLSSLQGIDGLENLVGDTEAVSNLAGALAGLDGDEAKVSAWNTFLTALTNNADGLTKLTGTSVSETTEKLGELAEKAKALQPGDVQGWSDLMGALIGLVDLNTEGGKNFAETLATQFLTMGTNSKEAVEGLQALGYGTDEIEEKQAAWLAVCKELSETIPGISSLIDAQTGEIKGGLPALKEYVDEWEKAQKLQAEADAYKAEVDVYNQENNLGKKRGAMDAAKAVYLLRAKKRFDELGFNYSDEELENAANFIKLYFDKNLGTKQELYNDLEDVFAGYFTGKTELGSTDDIIYKSIQEPDDESLVEATEAYIDAVEAYYISQRELPVVSEQLEKNYAELEAAAAAAGVSLEEYMEAQEEAAASMSVLEKAAAGDAEAIEQIQKAAENAKEALTNLNDYVESVRNETASDVAGVLSGFGDVKTAAEQYEEAANAAKEFREELEKQRDEGKNNLTDYEIELKVNDKNAQITLEGMTESLQHQLNYINEYQKNLAKARKAGISDEILAQLSDGSNESAMYLHAIAEAADQEDWAGIEALNKMWEEVNAGKETFIDELTAQKLAVDETYDELVKKAEEAAKALDVSGTAGESTKNNIKAIEQALKDNIPGIAEQVDAILKELNRLDSWGFTVDFGGGSSVHVEKPGAQDVLNGEFAAGLDYVPFDGFLASLHEGEGILTAEENRIWQRFRSGGSGVDYDQLGGVMRDNIRPGGDVYLDGRTVGRVISDMQGAQYRNLQRSGWQQ